MRHLAISTHHARSIALVAILGLLLSASDGIATGMCEILGPAAQFAVVATEKLTTANYSRSAFLHQIPYPNFFESACAATISAGLLGNWEDMVGAASTGTAISFQILKQKFGGGHEFYPYCYSYPGPYYPCNANLVYGDVVTGGGRISAFRDLLPRNVTLVDTTGNHPLVEPCNSSIARVQSVSASLARGLLPGEPPSAARSIIDLGDVFVPKGEEVDLQSTGAPLTIYNVHNLTIETGHRVEYYQVPYITGGGTLNLITGPDEGLVINVTGRLKIGRGTEVSGDDLTTLINVPGKGPAISLRQTTFQVPLLAPERNLNVEALGGGTELYYDRTPNVAGRKLRVIGSAAMGYQSDLPRECGFSQY